MDKLIKAAEQIAFQEIEKNGMPIKMHVDLSTAKGLELAEKLHADKDIVHIGTLMMDCMLGEAIDANKVSEHVQMSQTRTTQMLAQFPQVDEQIRANIEHCVLQHHGAVPFYSLESEISSNADCYRFLSVKGFFIAIRYLRDMPFDEMIELVSSKVDEKWNILTLDICKEELAPQYEIIQKVLARLKA